MFDRYYLLFCCCYLKLSLAVKARQALDPESSLSALIAGMTGAHHGAQVENSGLDASLGVWS